MIENNVEIPADGRTLKGILSIPESSSGIVVFAHGSGSSRLSGRNQFVAKALQQAGLATLLMDLLEEGEELDRDKVFDIPLLAERLEYARAWLKGPDKTKDLSIGYFGASTGAGAALVAAAIKPDEIKAVVSRGGRPDLASDYLTQVKAPSLLIVGGNDDVVIDLNKQAYALLTCEKNIEIIPGATHLFEEPGTLEEVARLAEGWFLKYLA